MDPKTKDVAATVIGGGTGVDLFWTGLDGLWKSYLAHEPIEIMHCKLMIYGIIAAYLGFLAWRDERHKMIEQTTVTKETVVQEIKP